MTGPQKTRLGQMAESSGRTTGRTKWPNQVAEPWAKWPVAEPWANVAELALATNGVAAEDSPGERKANTPRAAMAWSWPAICQGQGGARWHQPPIVVTDQLRDAELEAQASFRLRHHGLLRP